MCGTDLRRSPQLCYCTQERFSATKCKSWTQCEYEMAGWCHCVTISATTTLLSLLMKRQTIHFISDLTVQKKSVWFTHIKWLCQPFDELLQTVWLGGSFQLFQAESLSWVQIFNAQIIECVSFVYRNTFEWGNFKSLESRFGVNPSLLPVAVTVSDHRQNHRFLRGGQEGKQKVWWLFDHLNSLVSTGSGACEKVGGTSATAMRSKKLQETRGITFGIRRHSIFELGVHIGALLWLRFVLIKVCAA